MYSYLPILQNQTPWGDLQGTPAREGFLARIEIWTLLLRQEASQATEICAHFSTLSLPLLFRASRPSPSQSQRCPPAKCSQRAVARPTAQKQPLLFFGISNYQCIIGMIWLFPLENVSEVKGTVGGWIENGLRELLRTGKEHPHQPWLHQSERDNVIPGLVEKLSAGVFWGLCRTFFSFYSLFFM